MIERKEYNKAIKLWWVLFQRSQCYVLYSFSRAYHNWYVTWDQPQVYNLLKGVDRIRRSLDHNAIFNRIYIPKPTGATWEESTGIRPLGVPNREWRIILKMINDILYLVIEPLIGDYQTGFRPRRSYEDAWKIIISKVKAGKSLYEFDLKACFNLISSNSILEWFKRNSIYPPFGNYIRNLINTSPIFDPLELEKIKVLGDGTKQRQGEKDMEIRTLEADAKVYTYKEQIHDPSLYSLEGRKAKITWVLLAKLPGIRLDVWWFNIVDCPHRRWDCLVQL